MDEDVFKEISRKLGIIIGLLAVDKLTELSADEQIDYLYRLGVEREAIAEMRGMTTKSVGEALSRVKAKRKS